MDYTCASWSRRWGGQTKVRCSFPDLVLEQFLEIMQWHQMNETLLTTAWHRSMTDLGAGKVSVRHGRWEFSMQQCQDSCVETKPFSWKWIHTVCVTAVLVSPSHSSWVPDAGRGRQEEELQTAVLLCVRTTVYLTTSLPKSSVWTPQLCALVMAQTTLPSLPLSHKFQEKKAGWGGAYVPSSAFYLILSELNLCNATLWDVLMVPLTVITFFC